MCHRLIRAAFAGALFTLGTASLPAIAQDGVTYLPGWDETLTPMGAIRAGNAEGTIPTWTGGITEPPPGYQPGRQHIDPFPEDEPLFVITAQNYQQYADKLSEGHKAMFERYPDTYRMPVYQTRRTASAPQRIYTATMENAGRAQLIEDGNGVAGASEGIPFPKPEVGLHGVWNHLLRWRGNEVRRRLGQANPTADGSYTMIMIEENAVFDYSQPDEREDENISVYFRQEVVSPARLAGEILLVHETINQVQEPRSAWTYNPGQRRVRRAPNVAYDNPGTAADGLRTSDNLDIFNGAPDRYDWRLLGRQEIYVPYNAYRLHSGELEYDEIIQAGHINQDLTRYELHRVWVVEGTVKDGTSHIYATRRFYLDEDSWAILIADHYDARGELWRVAESHPINYYEVPALWATLDAIYDLQSGRYTAIGFDNQETPYDFDVGLDINDFSPAALRRAGRR